MPLVTESRARRCVIKSGLCWEIIYGLRFSCWSSLYRKSRRKVVGRKADTRSGIWFVKPTLRLKSQLLLMLGGFFRARSVFCPQPLIVIPPHRTRRPALLSPYTFSLKSVDLSGVWKITRGHVCTLRMSVPSRPAASLTRLVNLASLDFSTIYWLKTTRVYAYTPRVELPSRPAASLTCPFLWRKFGVYGL